MPFGMLVAAACGHPNPPDDARPPETPTIGSPCSTDSDCPPSTPQHPDVACVYRLSDRCVPDAGKTYLTCDGGTVIRSRRGLTGFSLLGARR